MADWQVGDTFRILEDCDFYGIAPYGGTIDGELYIITYSADEPDDWPDDWNGEWEAGSAYEPDIYRITRIDNLGDDPYIEPYDPFQWWMCENVLSECLDEEKVELIDGPSYHGQERLKLCPYCQGKIEYFKESRIRVCSECFRKVEK